MKLYLATGNAHKLSELRAMLARAGLGCEVHAPSSVGGMPPVVEDQDSFSGNALKKARALAGLLPMDGWALADDSGLCVDALGGQPGVRSARYAGENSSDSANLSKLLLEMKDLPPASRRASFQCHLAMVAPSGEECVFEGRCEGWIEFGPRGAGGFGYDPVFRPEGKESTFAQLSEEEKAGLSHRGAAMAQLVDYLKVRTAG